MMLLDRTIQPKVRDIEHLAVQMPQRFIMPNGVPLNIPLIPQHYNLTLFISS